MPENLTDNELVTRLREDDVEAFNALYWKYHEAVYANIFKLTKETETTNDILQEVFIALWEKRAMLDSNKSVSGWLFVTSYNNSISYLRKVLRDPVSGNELNEEMEHTEELEINIKEVQLQLLEKAINQLSPQKKKVFELCKLQGKTYEETAKELNLSKHTVKEYLSSAIADIKEYVKTHPGHLITFFSPLLLSQFVS